MRVHRLALVATILVIGFSGFVRGWETQNTAPRTIILIRHGEHGSKGKFREDRVNLTRGGLQRAGFITSWFPISFGRPDYIFAARQKDSTKSERPYQTIAPLGLNQASHIDARSFGSSETESLVDFLFAHGKFKDKLVLICWHHAKLFQLTEQFMTGPYLPLHRMFRHKTTSAKQQPVLNVEDDEEVATDVYPSPELTASAARTERRYRRRGSALVLSDASTNTSDAASAGSNNVAEEGEDAWTERWASSLPKKWCADDFDSWFRIDFDTKRGIATFSRGKQGFLPTYP